MRLFKQTLFLISILAWVTFATSAYSAGAVKIFDTDGVPQGLDMTDGKLNLNSSGSGGSVTKVIYMSSDTDGTSQQLALPAGETCNEILIQVHSGVATDYSVDSSCSGFLYSHSEGGSFAVVSNTGLSLSITKQVSVSDTSLGWVKAPAGNKLVLFILY